MYPFIMNANSFSLYNDPINNNNNKTNLCESCNQNEIGVDLSLIIPQQNKSLETSIVIVKCLDCNHFLCFTCYLAHGSMQYFQNHHVEITDMKKNVIPPPFSQSLFNKRKHFEIDSIDDGFSILKSKKTSDWPPAFVPNLSSDLSSNSPDGLSERAISESSSSNNSTLEQLNGLDFSVEALKKYIDIENQIRITFGFCEQILLNRRDNLLNDLKTFYQDMGDNFENIQFVTNLFNIKSSINDTFGYINCLNVESKKLFTENNQLHDASQLGYMPKLERNPFSFKFRTKMIMELAFGGQGLENNRFTEPNGISIDKNNNIIVADSNSNYMKCFKPDGAFRFKFGIEKLLFPNKVACHKETGNFVIIERKPAHEIKIFSPTGEFIRRFGSGLLKSPRGVCIDRKSRIVILESKIMRILIFTIDGALIHYFDVADYFKFANSICTSNTDDTIYISDNHSHCIRAFSYEGKFLRQIGGPGLTNFPTSVDVNSKNEILITDNYNCFNLTILSENGDLLRAFESKTKHVRILDVTIVNDESIMFSSRDNHIYKYKF